MKRIAVLVLMAMILSMTAYGEAPISHELYVKQVSNLPEDFIFGMDASCVPSLENSGVKYYGFDGQEQDVFKTLSESGVTHIRVRVWNDPYDASGHGYGGGNCDVANAIAIGQRATSYGMKLIVDFHYSDFWADPSKQTVPKAWRGMKVEQKTQAVYEFTKDALNQLKDAGVAVGMVQVGNETNSYMCGEKSWFDITYLIDAGAKATREVYPEALVAVHFTNPEKVDSLVGYAGKLDYYAVDYDVFGTSWYPYWHGSLENLTNELNKVSAKYGKKTMVLETSYAYTEEDSDFFGNTIGAGVDGGYPFTVQGQANLLRALTDAIANDAQNGIGICYWEGTWISVGGESWEENHALWEKYGSGWATSYAGTYDPNDAGKYYGGCAVDNQALFDRWGHPLESLKVFGLMRGGNEIALKPDAIENAYVTNDINGAIALPESVNAVMNDGSKRKVPVQWDADEAALAKMKATGVGTYPIFGEAGGMEAVCYLTLIEYNYLADWSFEDNSGVWQITDLKKADELYIEDKKTDSLTGTTHVHFWSKAQNSVEFTVEQQVQDLAPGK
ncbi:MAG: glycosyl hydrolase 53 family protein, partial [Clostridia bacterium]|nr:glycosyl hydrolase 53 family protein [Clostridia bacterium]